LTLNEFQQHALRTATRPLEAYPQWIRSMVPHCWDQREAMKDWDAMVLCAGLTGEAGEVADYLKKVFGHGHPLDVDRVKNEISDVLWYCAVLADRFGLTLADIAAANVEKLKARYPSGFSVAASQARTE
jgi:NTP pyrophosphatase (non-canonical NTP hydrolase)